MHWGQTVLLAVLAFILAAIPAQAQRYYGDLVLKPVQDGSHMHVVNRFGFIDAKGKDWEVLANYKTDGASIPRYLWSVTGSPYTGKYLAAAIIHDYYCDVKDRDWRDVHHVFYEAMRASGVDDIQAKVMYYAVYRFGPKWIVNKRYNASEGSACYEPTSDGRVVRLHITPQFVDREFDYMKKRINEGKMGLMELINTADEQLLVDNTVVHVKGTLEKNNSTFEVDKTMRIRGWLQLLLLN